MLPLLPFAAGLIAGALAVRYARSGTARTDLARVREGVRTATDTGFATLKRSTAAVRAHLAPTPEVAPVADAAPVKAKRTRRPRQPAAKTAAPENTPAEAGKPRARRAAPRKKAVVERGAPEDAS